MMTTSIQRRAREAAGLRVIDIASRARCSTAPVQRYELVPESVTPRIRSALDSVYRPLIEAMPRS